MDRSRLCENLLLHCPPSPYESLIKSQPECSSPQQWGSHAENPLVERKIKKKIEHQDFFIFFILCQHSWEFCHVTPSALTLTRSPQHPNLSNSHLIMRASMGGAKIKETFCYPRISSRTSAQLQLHSIVAKTFFSFPRWCQTARKTFP